MMWKNAQGFVSLLFVFALLAGTTQGDLQTGLVAHWEFEGDFTDSAGGNDATPKGDAKIVTDAERGQVVEFDGTGDYLEIPNSPSLNITGDQLTLAAWVWHDNVAGDPEIIIAKVYNNTTHQSPYFSYGLHILTNGQPRIWISRTGGTANAPGTTNLQSATWYHLAGVYDGTQLRLYLNGKQVAGNNVSGNLIGYDTVLRLGINGGLTEPMDGKLDDVRIYNRALNELEILSLVTGIAPDKAWKPEPADKASAVSMPLLQWSPGEGAIFHDVYLGTSPDLTEANRVAQHSMLTMYYHAPGLEPGATYYWRIDEIEADGTTVHPGVLWSFTVQALTAYQPGPADGAVDASPAPTLTWLPGQAAVKHHVYFSDTLDAVQQRAAGADKGEVADATFSPGALAGATMYYWAVDEVVASGATKAGPVWSFSTYLPVDDFESYTDDEGSRIYETWVDGWTNNTGSTVGYVQAPFAERAIVHGGQQSMPLDYNNVKSPFYSEAEQEFATAQDWTVGDVTTLVLFVRGRLNNGPAPLYFAVQDASNKTATVIHPDAAVVGTAKWTEWKIPLSDVTGVNLARVKKITIGLGNKDNPKGGGAGLIYVDDIRLIKS
jgi:hypothetical protein